jgi:hypothetical protein
LNYTRTGAKPLPDVGGPNLEAFAYASVSANLTGSIDMEYLILDPLTKEKLERHKLKTKTVSQPVNALAQGTFDQKTGKAQNYQDLATWAVKNPSYRSYYSNYNNLDNVSTRMFESLFKETVPQIDKLISVEEFNHLSKYKKTLEQKKVY